MRGFVTCLMIVAMPVLFINQTCAANLSDIRAGDRYYMYQLVGENEVVEVIDVDRGNGSVRVRHTGGRERWVRPEDLLNRLQSEAADTATNVGVAVGIGVVIYCAAYPNECKK